MGNIISYNTYSEAFIQLSNNRADRLYAILLIHGSAMAVQPFELCMVLWYAELDQSITGRGLVGFDILDMPWEVENLSAQKKFWDLWLLKCKEDHCANMLDIDDASSTEFENLNAHFEDLRMWGLNITAAQLISHNKDAKKSLLSIQQFASIEYVPCHKIIKTANGCYICNNYPNLKK